MSPTDLGEPGQDVQWNDLRAWLCSLWSTPGQCVSPKVCPQQEIRDRPARSRPLSGEKSPAGLHMKKIPFVRKLLSIFHAAGFDLQLMGRAANTQPVCPLKTWKWHTLSLELEQDKSFLINNSFDVVLSKVQYAVSGLVHHNCNHTSAYM